VPLKLVTGPANSAKAGEVLGALRGSLDDDPILVVPAFQDVEHAQRELAERGAVFGARVLRFAWLFEAIAERSGYAARKASALQRELIMEDAAAAAGLRVLAPSAEHPGFARAAVAFAAELEGAMVEPPRFTAALRAWAANGPRRGYAEEVAAIYRGYRERLRAASLVDPELFAWRALDSLRRDPSRWGETPVFVYGFDDFTPLELDALETLARHCCAEVIVSLPFEPGRAAFRAVAEAYAALSDLADERVALEPLSDHYAGSSRDALHHLERGLFELSGAPRRDPGGAVRLHSAGGERAEVELAAAEVLEQLRAGVPPGELAVVFRDPARYASLVEQVFGAYGIPYSIDRSVPLAHTNLGRGLLAVLRASRADGRPEDLLGWLRTPGKLEQAALADRLEAEVRRSGVRSAAEARRLWEERNPRFPLTELDALAAQRDLPGLLEELDAQLQSLFVGPYRRRAPVLQGAELDDTRAFVAAHDALRELHAVLRAGLGRRLTPEVVGDRLAGLPVRVGDNPQPDRVQVARPEAIRARRFAAVLVCGLQEDEFPRAAAPEPFLPDQDRRELAKASGLVLPMREDRLDRERYLFYVCASRAERLLVLSSRYCDEEGDPQAGSFVVEDVRELFAELPVRRRSLSEVTWAPEDAPTAEEHARAVAARGPRREQQIPGSLTSAVLLEELAGRPLSAGALERFADCPVKWLVESVLRPDALEPDPEQLVRGRFAHAVLHATYRRLREETGRARVTPETLAAAERILLHELGEQQERFRISPDQTRVRAAVRRLELDLLAHLRWEAGYDGAFEPVELELDFGPVEVAEGVTVAGRIDRVDAADGQALVIDYKSGKSVGRYKLASWEQENQFQGALYALALAATGEREPVGALYQPLAGEDRRPRGMVAEGVPGLGSRFFDADRVDRERFAEVLERARERIAETAARLRRGELGCDPERCSFRGGCSYPSICRCDG
jgi:ATP-dependent helicase/DNAse subunit B